MERGVQTDTALLTIPVSASVGDGHARKQVGHDGSALTVSVQLGSLGAWQAEGWRIIIVVILIIVVVVIITVIKVGEINHGVLRGVL